MPRTQPDEGAFSGAQPAPRAIGPQDIQQKEFAVSRFGGYKMRDVDEFLDELTASIGALIAENDRLRTQASAAPVLGSPDLDDVSRQADEIIQRARDEAASIVAQARSQAGDPAGVGDPDARPAVGAFLAQERDFLQRLAGVVQEHAETVKAMARRARTPASESMPGPEAEPDEPAGAEHAAETTAESEEPEDDARPEPEAEASPDPDATQAMEGGAEPVRVVEPEPAQTRSSREDEGDSSLRELFWGEDG
jgi:DivIVA domain-containing protein